MALVLIGFAVCCYSSNMFKNLSVGGIKNYITSFGVFAPIIYILMFTCAAITLFPDGMIAVAGGLSFGVYLGTIYTIIGACGGATLAFYICRIFGRGVVEKLIKHKAELFEEGVEKRGLIIILLLRLIPMIPFDLISYGAGISKIKYMDFILGTIVGVIPGVLVYTNIGDKIVNIWSFEFLFALLIFASLCVFSYLLKKKLSKINIMNHVLEESHD